VSRKSSNNLVSDFTKNMSKRSRPRVKPGVIVFWAGFALIMGVLFMVNRERINNTIRNAPFPAWFSSGKGAETPPVSDTLPATSGEMVSDTTLSDEMFEDVDDGDNGIDPLVSDATTSEGGAAGTEQSVATGSGVVAEKVSDTTVEGGAAVPSAASGATSGATQSRSLYFIQVDREGTILRSPVVRPIAVSGSPLQDTLRTLIQGPTVEEIGRGLISLIPEGTQLLSVTIRGQTAFINLSEEFRFNHYGIEGYAAQVHQLVWTATEFPTVKDAQILIDGQRVDWLVEGLWIGSPLKRDSL
jgi:spore germination protein GerM